MANTMTKIATTTLSAIQYTVTFSSIPNTYTDLILKVSSRTDYGSIWDGGTSIYFNGDNAGTNYSSTEIQGNNSSVISQRFTNNPYAYVGVNDSAANTSNVFGNFDFYISNYTTSNYKNFIGDLVAENNSAAGYQNLTAGLWRSTSTITSISIQGGSGNFAANSKFTLYGI
jgi:hypothetical protein